MNQISRIVALTLAAVALSVSGCLTCCPPTYDMYPAYGGSWERTNRMRGRVGSVLDPAGTRMLPESVMDADQSAPSPAVEDVETPEPMPADSNDDAEPSDLPPLPDDDAAPLPDTTPPAPLPDTTPPAPLPDTAPPAPDGGGTTSMEQPVNAPPPVQGPRLMPATDRVSSLYEPLR